MGFFSALGGFVLGFFKVEYNVPLKETPDIKLSPIGMNKMLNELRNIPFSDIKFCIEEYSVKRSAQPAPILAEMYRTKESQSFTRVNMEYMPNTGQKKFFIENHIFVLALDGWIHEVTISGYIKGIIYNNEFDNTIVNAFITYCNDILDEYELTKILKTDCKISFLQDKTRVFNRHIEGFDVIDSSSMIWTNGHQKEGYIKAFTDMGIYEALGIERICPRLEENKASIRYINCTDRVLLTPELFMRRLQAINEKTIADSMEEIRNKMIVPVHNKPQ